MAGQWGSYRVSDKQVRDMVANMQRQGMDVGLDGQYGKFRVTTKDESRNLSPRANNRTIYEWLDAYRTGWYELELAIKRGRLTAQYGEGIVLTPDRGTGNQDGDHRGTGTSATPDTSTDHPAP